MADNYPEFYRQVYTEQDNPPTEAHGWIQWKGTGVCMDTHCSCGYHGHVDADFFYFYECPKCRKKYAVGQTVKLIPLTEDLIALGGIELDRFTTCELDEEG